MPKCGFILVSITIVKIRTPRSARFWLYNSPAWLRLLPTETMSLSHPGVLVSSSSLQISEAIFVFPGPWHRSVQPVARKLKFCCPRKVLDFKKVLPIFHGRPASCYTHRTWHMQPWAGVQSGYVQGRRNSGRAWRAVKKLEGNGNL